MNELEKQLDYCRGTETPEPGRTIEVAPGVFWARMTLPFALNHINVWLLRDARPAEGGEPAQQGWAIVDCGIDNAATRAAWEELFATVLGGLPVLRVIVTHMHPDHIGSAHWLCERWSARLWISATDFGIARIATSASAGFAGRSRPPSWRRTGWPPTARRSAASRAQNYYKSLVPAVPASYRPLARWRRIADGSARDAPTGPATSATAMRPSTCRSIASRSAS
jgi:hypothetical protein